MSVKVKENGNIRVVEGSVENKKKDTNWINEYFISGADPVGRQEFQNHIQDLNKLYEKCRDFLQRLYEFDGADFSTIRNNKVKCIVLCNEERYLKYPAHTDWSAIDDWSDEDMVLSIKLNLDYIKEHSDTIDKSLLNAYLDWLYDIKKQESIDLRNSQEIFKMIQERARTNFKARSYQKAVREEGRKEYE